MPLLRPLYDLERRWRAHYNVVPVDDETWRRARIYNAWFDHAILRVLWHNQSEIAPGVFRSNQPDLRRLTRLRDAGLRSVISLRGESETAHHGSEAAWCAALGLSFHCVGLTDKNAPSRAALLTLLDLFGTVERPFLMHCKAGADRAGLAAVLYLMVVEGRSLRAARRHLSFRYLHLRRSRAGVLDVLLDSYAEAAEAAGGEAALPIADWIASDYDPAAIGARFRARG